jgi:dynein light chain Tctex-type 1
MSFDVEEIKSIVKQVIRNIIGEKTFVSEHVRQWHADILTNVVQQLKQFEQRRMPSISMKYVVTVIIGEKSSSINQSLHTALTCLWDSTTDGCMAIKWENRHVYSIVSVFGLLT